MSSNACAAHLLGYAVDHLIDMSYDISLIRWPGSESLFFGSKDLARIPNPLRFVANFGTVRRLDFPVAEPRDLSVMSPRMLDVLLSVGRFEHQLHPVVLIDDTVEPAKRYRDDGTLRPEVTNTSFGFVRLTSYADAFDWDRSTYERDDALVGEVSMIKKFVLRDIALPPLFRLSAYPYALFVSDAARVALEKANIRGVDFSPYWMGFQPPDAD